MSAEDIQWINLMNHETTWDRSVDAEVIKPSGSIARVFFEQELDHHVGGIPSYRNVNGWIKGLPKPRPGIRYIVSGIVFQSVLRPDVYTPNTQPWSVSHKTYGKVASVKGLLCAPRTIA